MSMQYPYEGSGQRMPAIEYTGASYGSSRLVNGIPYYKRLRLWSRKASHIAAKKGYRNKERCELDSSNATTLVNESKSITKYPDLPDEMLRMGLAESTVAPSDSISNVQEHNHAGGLTPKLPISSFDPFAILSSKEKILAHLQQTALPKYEKTDEHAIDFDWLRYQQEELEWNKVVEPTELESVPSTSNRKELPATLSVCVKNNPMPGRLHELESTSDNDKDANINGVNMECSHTTRSVVSKSLISPLVSSTLTESPLTRVSPVPEEVCQHPPTDSSTSMARTRIQELPVTAITIPSSKCGEDEVTLGNANTLATSCNKSESPEESLSLSKDIEHDTANANDKQSLSDTTESIEISAAFDSSIRSATAGLSRLQISESPETSQEYNSHNLHSASSASTNQSFFRFNAASPSASIESATPFTPDTPMSTIFMSDEDADTTALQQAQDAIDNLLLPEILRTFSAINKARLEARINDFLRLGTPRINTYGINASSKHTSQNERHTSGGHTTQNHSARNNERARKRLRENDDDRNEDEEEEEDSRQPFDSPKRFAASNYQKLACHFYVSDPDRFRHTQENKRFKTCSRGFIDPKHLKEHLQRVHFPPIHCERCSTIFKSHPDRLRHMRQPTQCQLREDPGLAQAYIMGQHQQKEISKKKSPKTSTEQHWYNIWHVLFPGVAEPASIFTRYSEFNAIFERVVDELVPRFAKEHMEPETENRRLRKFVIAIRDYILDLLDDDSQLLLQKASDRASQSIQPDDQADDLQLLVRNAVYEEFPVVPEPSVKTRPPVLQLALPQNSSSMLTDFTPNHLAFNFDSDRSSTEFQSSTSGGSIESALFNQSQFTFAPYDPSARFVSDNFQGVTCVPPVDPDMHTNYPSTYLQSNTYSYNGQFGQ